MMKRNPVEVCDDFSSEVRGRIRLTELLGAHIKNVEEERRETQ